MLDFLPFAHPGVAPLTLVSPAFSELRRGAHRERMPGANSPYYHLIEDSKLLNASLLICPLTDVKLHCGYVALYEKMVPGEMTSLPRL
jgi:hypothetical protein